MSSKLMSHIQILWKGSFLKWSFFNFSNFIFVLLTPSGVKYLNANPHTVLIELHENWWNFTCEYFHKSDLLDIWDFHFHQKIEYFIFHNMGPCGERTHVVLQVNLWSFGALAIKWHGTKPLFIVMWKEFKIFVSRGTGSSWSCIDIMSFWVVSACHWEFLW